MNDICGANSNGVLDGCTITKELAGDLVVQVDNLVLYYFFVVVVKRKVSSQ